MNNFWQNLPRPIFCLAPMEEVTDFAFREMFAKYGKPDVMFTEFINVDGLTHAEGGKKLAIDLKYSELQRPIVAQIWGRTPLKFAEAAKIITDLGFDGIDINMGCPQDKEIKGGACAALIREPRLAQEIIAATKKAAGDLPVSVKTRLGYSKPEEMADWLKYLLETDITAVTLHARTKQEKSKVPAHWDKIKQAVELRNQLRNSTLIIGNGDIKSRQEGLGRISETGCDGVMVGRGAFGNPWFFVQSNKNINAGIRRSLGEGGSADGYQPEIKERFRVMLEHAGLFEQTFSGQKSFAIMRKHFKAYCSGFPGAHELRAKLMETKNLDETRSLVGSHLKFIIP